MKVTAGVAKQIASGDDETMRRSLVEFVEQVSFILNGNTDVVDNLKVEVHEVNFTLPTASEVDVRHTLGRKARGYIVVRRSKALSVSDGDTDWNDKSIFLKSTVRGTVSVLVF